MVKTYAKNIFSALLCFIVILCFAPMFGTRTYAANTYGAIESDTKPPIKKTGISGSYAVIADYDNCLTESQENELLDILHEVAIKAKMNVGIVITKDLEGKSDEGYNHAFIKDNFGNNSNSVVLLLLNRYNNPKYSSYTDTITSYGRADKKFGNKYKRIFDRIYKKMGDPIGNKNAYNETTKTYGGYKYMEACVEFAACVKIYGSSGAAALPVLFSDYITKSFMKFAGGLAIAVFITMIVVRAKVKSYKKKAAVSASTYLDRRATRVTHQVDRFIREYTTSHTHSSSSGGGGHSGGGHSSGHGRGR